MAIYYMETGRIPDIPRQLKKWQGAARVPTDTQCACLDSIGRKVARFLNARDGSAIRVPDTDCQEKLRGSQIGYGEEEVKTGLAIVYDALAPGLPTAESCARVPLLALAEGRVAHLLRHPEECLLPEAGRPPEPPRTWIWADKAE